MVGFRYRISVRSNKVRFRLSLDRICIFLFRLDIIEIVVNFVMIMIRIICIVLLMGILKRWFKLVFICKIL